MAEPLAAPEKNIRLSDSADGVDAEMGTTNDQSEGLTKPANWNQMNDNQKKKWLKRHARSKWG